VTKHPIAKTLRFLIKINKKKSCLFNRARARAGARGRARQGVQLKVLFPLNKLINSETAFASIPPILR
jgi:hypothetical protein